jgi:hypothetical protein
VWGYLLGLLVRHLLLLLPLLLLLGAGAVEGLRGVAAVRGLLGVAVGHLALLLLLPLLLLRELVGALCQQQQQQQQEVASSRLQRVASRAMRRLESCILAAVLFIGLLHGQ